MDNSYIGRKGEDIAALFLERNGHTIVSKNYRMKFGEIDVVSRKDGTLYFIEVKSFAKETEGKGLSYRIEERVDRSKLQKLARVIEHYLLHECREEESSWEFWVITVTLDVARKKAYVKVIPETLEG